jgi:hypothetical protein
MTMSNQEAHDLLKMIKALQVRVTALEKRTFVVVTTNDPIEGGGGEPPPNPPPPSGGGVGHP